MKNNFQSKAVPRGTRTIWRYLSALILLFSLSIGQMWGADPTYDDPARVTYAEKTFLDVAGTAANVTGTDNYLCYGTLYMFQTVTGDKFFARTSGSGGTSSSSYTYATPATGFLAANSTSATNTYGSVNAASSRPWAVYFTGAAEVSVLKKDNNTSSNKWVTLKLYTVAADGTETLVETKEESSPDKNNIKVLSCATTLSASAYYKLEITSGNTSNCPIYQVSFKQPDACSTEITTQPSGATLAVGDANPTLSVVATNAASYAWKESSDGTSYDGGSTLASAASFTPEVNDAVQTKYYYCEVTSDCDGTTVVKSNIVTVNVVGAITYYTVTLVPAGGTIVDATGWTLNAGNYEKEVAEGTVLTLPTFTKTDRAFKTWRKAGPADVASPVTVDGDLSLTAIWTATIEQVIYSWEGAEGGAIETGGTASSSTDGGSSFDDAQINVKQAETELYCLQINGNNSFGTNLVQITLAGEEKVKTGDKIKYWGFYSKSSNANARPKMRDANGSNASIFDDPNNLPNLYNGGDPAERTFTVPAGINTSAVQITRSQTGSNTWISKLQIIREVQVEEGDLLTVTFDANGGSAIAPVVVASGQAVAKPTDPTWAHHRFNEWQLAGSAYDFSSAVTTDITLVANWTQLYTISFAAGDGSGDAPAAIADKAKDETFEVPANTFTAPASKEFDKWNDGSADYAPGATYTVGTANVVLTAQWKAVTAKYTVIFKDGETTLDTKLFEVGSNPSDAGIDKTKALFTFAAWQLSGSDIALDDASWASVAANAEVTLTARWAKAYATDVDFETEAVGHAGDEDYAKSIVDAHNYALSTKTGTTFDENTSTNNGAYLGLKIKNAGTTLSWNVVAGKVVELKAGVMVANGSLAINGGAATEIDGGSTGSGDNFKIHYFYSATEALYEFTTSNGSAEVIKAITMRDPYTVSFEAHGDADPSALPGLPSVTLPAASNGTESLLGWFTEETGGTKIGDAGDTYIPTANITLHAQWESISTDARLASITFSSAAGTLEPAFDPEVVNYTYTMPYGTLAVPHITGATAVNAGGSYSIVSQASAWDETAVIRGVAASSDTKAYNITMKIAPKDPVCLVWADIPSANTLTYNASKSLLAEDAVTLAISGVSGKDGSAPSGVKFQKGGYIKIEKNEGTFEEGDIVALDVTYVAGSAMHVFKVQTPSTAADVIGTGATATTPAGVNKVTITEDATALYLARPDNESEYKDWNPHVDYVAVYRAMDPVLKSITFDGTKINVTGTSVSATLPNGADLTDVTPEIFWNGAGTAVVTTNEGAWDWGANTYVLTDKDGDATSYTITLTEDALKHTVSYYSYNGEDLLGTEQVEDGEHPTATGITAPSRLGFTFQGWAITVGGDVEDLNEIAISADDELYAVYAAIPCPTSGTVYKFEIKDGLASENLPIATDMDMSSYIDATGIGLLTYSATANSKATINSDGTIQLKDATAAYLKVELACALAAGDQIRAHVSNNPIRVQVGTTYDSSKDLILDKNAYDIVDITAAMEGLKVLYIARSTNGNANLADFEIYRRPALTDASLADLTIRQGVIKTPELTLEPSADAIVTSQAWEIVGDPVNLTDAAINPATGAITTGTLNDASLNGTIIVKVTLNGSIEATCTATVVDAVVQQNVTKSTIWNWQNTGATANIELSATTDPKRNEAFVLANVAVNNNADFESDKLVVEGQYMVRDYDKTNPYFQGQTIKFNTTKAGVVRVKFSNTGGNPARELYINGVGTGNSSANTTLNWSDYVEVPVGEVSMTAFYVDPAEGTGQQYIRVAEIEFLELIDKRTGIAAKDLGTACYEDEAIIIGAKAYMVDGVNASGYIVFDGLGEGEALEAGKPYLFESEGGTIYFCKKIGASHADEEIEVKGMIGSFLGTTLTQSETKNYCYFSGRHIWMVNNYAVDIPVPAHRCYVDYDVLTTSVASLAPAPGRRRVVLGVNGKDAAQGLEDVEGSENTIRKVMIDGNLYILRGEKVFDATGRLVK